MFRAQGLGFGVSSTRQVTQNTPDSGEASGKSSGACMEIALGLYDAQ